VAQCSFELSAITSKKLFNLNGWRILLNIMYDSFKVF
jgi:hypothetical protein